MRNPVLAMLLVAGVGQLAPHPATMAVPSGVDTVVVARGKACPVVLASARLDIPVGPACAGHFAGYTEADDGEPSVEVWRGTLVR